jgi:hypothetical protein
MRFWKRIAHATQRSIMRSKCSLVFATFFVAVVPADADRASRAPGPDAATLIRGEWVVAVVERDGIVTPQFDTLAERRLMRLDASIFHSNGRDVIADPQALPPAIPRDTLVYQFADGRFSVYKDLARVGWGRYRFRVAAPTPVLTLTWEQAPDRFPGEEQYRGLVRFRNGALEWCVDRANPKSIPTHFAADKGPLMIATFWRIRSRPAFDDSLALLDR